MCREVHGGGVGRTRWHVYGRAVHRAVVEVRGVAVFGKRADVVHTKGGQVRRAAVNGTGDKCTAVPHTERPAKCAE